MVKKMYLYLVTTDSVGNVRDERGGRNALSYLISITRLISTYSLSFAAIWEVPVSVARVKTRGWEFKIDIVPWVPPRLGY